MTRGGRIAPARMPDFGPPRFTVAKLNDLIKAELPGVQFRIEQDHGSFVTVMEFLRIREGYRAVITDEMNAYNLDALALVTLETIDRFREQAMVDYGLRVILEREKKAAFKDGFKAMVTNLRGYVDTKMQAYEILRDEDGDPILDEDGDVQEVLVGPSWEGHRILAWLDQLSKSVLYSSDRSAP